jgi:hypothetical protein
MADSVGRTVVRRGGFGASSGRRTRARPSFPCVFDQRPRNARALAARTVTCSRSATSSYVSHSSLIAVACTVLLRAGNAGWLRKG